MSLAVIRGLAALPSWYVQRSHEAKVEELRRGIRAATRDPTA
jgi:hypothetical protein